MINDDKSVHVSEDVDSPSMYQQDQRVAATELPNPFMDINKPQGSQSALPTPSPSDMKPQWKTPTYTIEPRKGKGWR